MAGYSLFVRPSAVKEIEALPKKDRAGIMDRIQGLAAGPRPPGCERLSGAEKYRIRQGLYRILYAIQDADLVVCVVKVGQRGDISRE